MKLSKREVSILIEIIFAVIFSLIYMPFFYDLRLNSLDIGDVSSKIIQILVLSVLYFSAAYGLLELSYKQKMIQDERDDMINSKSYKLGYVLYELSLFLFIGILLTGSSFEKNGAILFFVLVLLLITSFIKSLYQLYLYRTS
jgi:hypothetical protein